MIEEKITQRFLEIVYEDDDIEAMGEVLNDKFFIHCEVFNFNKTVLKKIRKVFSEIHEAVLDGGFTSMYSYTPNPKFAAMMDCNYRLITTIERKGKSYDVIQWLP